MYKWRFCKYSVYLLPQICFKIEFNVGGNKKEADSAELNLKEIAVDSQGSQCSEKCIRRRKKRIKIN